MNQTEKVRPTKKQQQTLRFIQEFILQHGYSPSYREIMRGCNYTSVATVALHINSLIKRGHLQKRDRSARSLEVIDSNTESKVKSGQVNEKQEKWLIEKIEYYFSRVEQSGEVKTADLDQLFVLVGALKVLGLEGAASSFLPRLSDLKKKKGKK